jgi:hypothetical protein
LHLPDAILSFAIAMMWCRHGKLRRRCQFIVRITLREVLDGAFYEVRLSILRESNCGIVLEALSLQVFL